MKEGIVRIAIPQNCVGKRIFRGFKFLKKFIFASACGKFGHSPMKKHIACSENVTIETKDSFVLSSIFSEPPCRATETINHMTPLPKCYSHSTAQK